MIKKKYPANKPELKKLLNGSLVSSSNLQVTISRIGVSVFKGRPKRKSGRLKDFCLPVSPIYFLFFLNGPGRTVMCSLYIYTSRCLKKNFSARCIIFSLRTDTRKQTITFFATNNNYPILLYKYKR